MRTNEQHGPISCVPIELLCSNNNINTVIYRAKPTNRPRRRVTGNLEEEEEEFICQVLQSSPAHTGSSLYVTDFTSTNMTITILIFIMAAHSNGQAIIFYACGFYILSFFLSFFLA